MFSDVCPDRKSLFYTSLGCIGSAIRFLNQYDAIENFIGGYGVLAGKPGHTIDVSSKSKEMDKHGYKSALDKKAKKRRANPLSLHKLFLHGLLPAEHPEFISPFCDIQKKGMAQFVIIGAMGFLFCLD